MRYREVELTDWERRIWAPIWACKRWLSAVERGYRDKHGFDQKKRDGLEAHYWGLCGEMAYAKAHNLYYTPPFDTFQQPDVGGVGVRTRTKHHWDLNIREEDLGYFVLVTVSLEKPARFRVYGGYEAARAKEHPEWFRTFDERPPAYFVPQSELDPFAAEELAMPPARVIPFPGKKGLTSVAT